VTDSLAGVTDAAEQLLRIENAVGELLRLTASTRVHEALVTATGVENLTDAAPKTVADVEAACKR